MDDENNDAAVLLVSDDASTDETSEVFQLGVIDSVGLIPPSLEKNFNWNLFDDFATEQANLLQNLGIKSVIIGSNTTRGPSMSDMEQHGFEALDALVVSLQKADREVGLVLGYENFSETQRNSDDDLWQNENEKKTYQTYVVNMVERYDYDGIDDAPELEEAVIIWQIQDSYPANIHQDSTSQIRLSAKNDALLLHTSAFLISEQLPEAIIISSHAPWIEEDDPLYGTNYMSAVSELGGYDDIDGVMIVGEGLDLRGVKEAVLEAQTISGRPVWMTMGILKNKDMPLVLVDDQKSRGKHNLSAEVLQLISGAFEAGAEKIFWHPLFSEINPTNDKPEETEWISLYGDCVKDEDISTFYGTPLCMNPQLTSFGNHFKTFINKKIGQVTLSK